MITPQEHSTFCSLKVPVAVSLHPRIVAELSFGECLSENDWLAPLLSEKVVAEFGCSAGLRAAYLAPYTQRILCTDPEAYYLRLARKTQRLNQRRNVVVVDGIADTTPADAVLLDTRRYSDGSLPKLALRAALLVITGPLPRSTASRALGAGYEHLPQYHRAAVFSAPRRQHGVQ